MSKPEDFSTTREKRKKEMRRRQKGKTFGRGVRKRYEAKLKEDKLSMLISSDASEIRKFLKAYKRKPKNFSNLIFMYNMETRTRNQFLDIFAGLKLDERLKFINRFINTQEDTDPTTFIKAYLKKDIVVSSEDFEEHKRVERPEIIREDKIKLTYRDEKHKEEIKELYKDKNILFEKLTKDRIKRLLSRLQGAKVIRPHAKLHNSWDNVSYKQLIDKEQIVGSQISKNYININANLYIENYYGIKPWIKNFDKTFIVTKGEELNAYAGEYKRSNQMKNILKDYKRYGYRQIYQSNRNIERLIYDSRSEQKGNTYKIYVEYKLIDAIIIHTRRNGERVVQSEKIRKNEISFLTALDKQNIYSGKLSIYNIFDKKSENVIKYKPWIVGYTKTLISPLDNTLKIEGDYVKTVNGKKWYNVSETYNLYRYGIFRLHHSQNGDIFTMYIGNGKTAKFMILHYAKGEYVIQTNKMYQDEKEWWEKINSFSRNKVNIELTSKKIENKYRLIIKKELLNTISDCYKKYDKSSDKINRISADIEEGIYVNNTTLVEYLMKAMKMLVVINQDSSMEIFQLRFVNDYYFNLKSLSEMSIENLCPEIFHNIRVSSDDMIKYKTRLLEAIMKNIYVLVDEVINNSFSHDLNNSFKYDYVDDIQNSCQNEVGEDTEKYELYHFKVNSLLYCVKISTIIKSINDGNDTVTITKDGKQEDIKIPQNVIQEITNRYGGVKSTLYKTEVMKEIGNLMLFELGIKEVEEEKEVDKCHICKKVEHLRDVKSMMTGKYMTICAVCKPEFMIKDSEEYSRTQRIKKRKKKKDETVKERMEKKLKLPDKEKREKLKSKELDKYMRDESIKIWGKKSMREIYEKYGLSSDKVKPMRELLILLGVKEKVAKKMKLLELNELFDTVIDKIKIERRKDRENLKVNVEIKNQYVSESIEEIFGKKILNITSYAENVKSSKEIRKDYINIKDENKENIVKYLKDTGIDDERLNVDKDILLEIIKAIIVKKELEESVSDEDIKQSVTKKDIEDLNSKSIHEIRQLLNNTKDTEELDILYENLSNDVILKVMGITRKKKEKKINIEKVREKLDKGIDLTEKEWGVLEAEADDDDFDIEKELEEEFEKEFGE